MGQRLSKPFLIENRPGDGRVSAATAFTKATPMATPDGGDERHLNEPLVGCGHVSGLLVRRGRPLALMLCADQVPIVRTHSKMR